MTKEEVFLAVSNVFGAYVWVVDGYWNVQIDTDPKREIVFSADWIRTHIDSDVSPLKQDDLEERLRVLTDTDWHLNKETGVLFHLVR